jgi:hypothetical protein
LDSTPAAFGEEILPVTKGGNVDAAAKADKFLKTDLRFIVGIFLALKRCKKASKTLPFNNPFG